MNSTVRPVRWSIGLAITALGLVLLAVAAEHSLRDFHVGLLFLFGTIVPLFLAAAVAGTGLRLATGDFDATESVLIAGWMLVGALGTGIIGVVVITYEMTHGVVLVDQAAIVANNVSVGAVGGFVIGIYDVRVRRHVGSLSRERDRLADHREKLLVLNRLVRHDIRNDLNVAIGMVDLLEDQTAAVGSEYLDRLDRSLMDAVYLTDSARDFLELLDDEDAVDCEPVDIAAMAREQVDSVRDAYPHAGISVDGDETAWATSSPLIASTVRNLLINAIQHNPSDAPRVAVTVEEADDDVILKVADDGPGIPDDRKDAVFHRDVQGIESTGTGIGLYLVEAIVDASGGEVSVEDSKEYGGAEFVIRLPMARGHPTSTDSTPVQAVVTT